MAQMNVPLTGKEKEQFKSVLKQKDNPKLLQPKEKIEKSTGRTLPIRNNR
jgi:hypothetical protein